MTGVSCVSCASTKLELVLDFGTIALAGGFLETPEPIAEPRVPLRIHICTACSLVQTCDRVDPVYLFTQYSFATGTVSALKTHFAEYAQWLRWRYDPKIVVEFGCNDGTLLQALAGYGIKTVGVDMAENISALAQEKGCTVEIGPFDTAMAETLRSEHGPVDIVTGSNVFAHVEYPADILQAATILLKPGGVLCLEVLDAGAIMFAGQWDMLYHEHVATYSLSALRALLRRHDFEVIYAERTAMHGGSLRVAARLASADRIEPSVTVYTHLEEEKAQQIDSVERWVEFGTQTRRTIDATHDVLTSLALVNTLWAYGASGRATMWLNACELGLAIEAIVDSSPLRAGKYMPGTHTSIVLPEVFRALPTPPDYVLITAWNYATQIRAAEAWYPGVWINPMPQLTFFP